MQASRHATLLLILGLSVPAAFAQDGVILRQVHPAASRDALQPLTIAPLSFVPPTDFSMRPSVFSTSLSPYGSGPQRLESSSACVLPSGTVAPNCDITYRWSVRGGSGGHVHNTSRPPGIFSTGNGRSGGSTDPGPPGLLTDNTGPTGVLSDTYTAPETSGITDLTITGTAVVNGVPLQFGPSRYTIGVQIEGLQLAAGNGFQVATFSNMHGNNNGHATPATNTSLQTMAEYFAESLTRLGTPPTQIPTLMISALSLPQGGLFDFRNEWSPPHVSHRFGNDADLVIPFLFDDERVALAKAGWEARFSTPVRCESPSNPGTGHWHLRLE